MNIFRISKIASHLSIGAALVALLLLVFPASLRADDNKNKKRDSTAQSKPAPSSKTPSASTSSKSSSSTSSPGGSGGSQTSGYTGGKHNTGNSGGTSSSGNTGRTRVSGSTGTTNTTSNSGGTSSTGDSGRKRAGRDTGATNTTNNSGGSTTGNVGRKRATDTTGSAKATGNSGATSTTGDSGASQKTGKSAKTRTTDATGARTSENSGGTNTTTTNVKGNKRDGANATGGSTGTSTTDVKGTKRDGIKSVGGSTGTSTTDVKGNKRDRTNSAGGTTGTSTTDVKGNKRNKTDSAGGTTGTSTTDVKGNKRTRTDSAGGTTGTSTSGKSGKVTTANVNPGFTRSSNGKRESYRGRDGSEARFRHDGTIREVHTRNMTIIHRPGGSRTVIVDRPDRSRIVVNRFGHGYVQRPFLYRGHDYAGRTYFYRGQPYSLYYRGYAYRGVTLHGYVPYRYYSPAFYGWAYRPWYQPVRYSWGWAGSPWYGYYGRYYFTPYASYPSASFWLTDYLISASLQAAYEERLANQSYNSLAPSDAVMLTPEVKDEISNEVQRQLALENSESRVAVNGDLDMNSSGLPRMLAETSPSNPRIFVVAGSLDVTDNQGQDCTLTEGDVLRLSTPPAPDATEAYLQVLATKNQSCAKGSMVSVGFADLQEMQNHMRATIDRGLQDLQAHQGGLPVPPANAATAPVQAAFAPIAPPPDTNASSELQQQARDADAADREVLNEVNQADSSAADSGASSTEPAEISLGQTISEVEAILGKPKQIVSLGAKKIYVYPSMKITFINGKVNDVE
jgi:hypothetical protein